MLDSTNTEGLVIPLSGPDPPTCPVDNSVMRPLTWREAAAEAGAIAGKWMRYANLLEEAWPADAAMPVMQD